MSLHVFIAAGRSGRGRWRGAPLVPWNRASRKYTPEGAARSSRVRPFQ